MSLRLLGEHEDEWLNAVRSLLEPKLRREMGSAAEGQSRALFPSRWTSAFADIVTGERPRISGSDIANIEQAPHRMLWTQLRSSEKSR